jgi:hypothetical protein
VGGGIGGAEESSCTGGESVVAIVEEGDLRFYFSVLGDCRHREELGWEERTLEIIRPM